jgi:2-oxoglutarate ferredoxin oxidoreductase subunit beta
MQEVFDRAIRHNGFSVVEVLSECVIFFAGAFDASIPRKGGVFEVIDEKKWDGTPEDEARHDVTDRAAAFALACQEWPGKFGVFYEDKDRPTKNALEQRWIDSVRGRTGGAGAKALLSQRFALMK